MDTKRPKMGQRPLMQWLRLRSHHYVGDRLKTQPDYPI